MSRTMDKTKNYIIKHRRILYDLFVAIENVITGASLVTKTVTNNLVEYKLNPLPNQPTVLILYDKAMNQENKHKNSTTVNAEVAKSDDVQWKGGPLSEQLASGNFIETGVELIATQTVNDLAKEREVGRQQIDSFWCSKPDNEKNSTKVNGIILKESKENNRGENSKPDILKEEEDKNRCDPIKLENLLRRKNDKSSRRKRKNADIQTKKMYMLKRNKKPLINYESIEQKIKENIPSQPSNLLGYETPKPTKLLYNCSYCEKCFPYESYKKIHERTHTGEKPYRCLYCEKTFAQSGNKRIHERVHTGEKPYKCNFCAKSFAQSRHKEVHERIHTAGKTLQMLSLSSLFHPNEFKISSQKVAYSRDFSL